jgi:quercetin dioxygenase-like cupin family protein
MAMKEHVLERHSADAPHEVRAFQDGMGQVELIHLSSGDAGRATFEPGWRWSDHVKPIAGTHSCQVEHIGYCMSGRMLIRMDNGAEIEMGPGDFSTIPPGHDAWVLGNEPCVMVDFGGLEGYALPH